MATKKKLVATESLRERILAAAWAEFGDKGFSGARMDEIAQTSGASKQVLFHHFSNKEGLFQAVLEKGLRDMRSSDASLRRSLSRSEPEAAIRKFIDVVFGTTPETIQFQKILHDENRFEAVHARKMHDIRGSYTSLLELLAQVLQRGATVGIFRWNIDPAELFASLEGLFMFRLTNRYTISAILELPMDSARGARESRAAAIEMVLDALRP